MTLEEMRALIGEAKKFRERLARIGGSVPDGSFLAMWCQTADALEAVLSPMPDEQLDEIEKRVAVATDGPWVADEFGYVRSAGKEAAGLGNFYPGDRGWAIFTAEGNYVEAAAYELADAEFVAHSREDVPALLAEVRRLRAWKAREELARLRALSSHPDEETVVQYGNQRPAPFEGVVTDRMWSLEDARSYERREPEFIAVQRTVRYGPWRPVSADGERS